MIIFRGNSSDKKYVASECALSSNAVEHPSDSNNYTNDSNKNILSQSILKEKKDKSTSSHIGSSSNALANFSGNNFTASNYN